MTKYFVPLGVFVLLIVLLAFGLKESPKKREIPSPLIDKSAPAFSLPSLFEAKEPFSTQQMLGKVWILNVWASWCPTCRQEHRAITMLSLTSNAPVVGLNYEDERESAQQWLNTYGNPYRYIPADTTGRIGIKWGVYATPETFIIDKKGVIRKKVTGAVTEEVVNKTLLPLVKKLQAEKIQ